MDLSIVTATYNEKENIGRLIETVNKICKENKIKNEVVVIDDSSPDGTSEIVKDYAKKYKNVVLVSRPPRSGIGTAYGDGAKVSKGDIIITMDADFSHPPSVLVEMYKKAKEGCMVSGSRFIGKQGFKTKIYRFIGTTILNKWIKFLFRADITDYSNGYLAIPKDFMGKIVKYGKDIGIYPQSG